MNLFKTTTRGDSPLDSSRGTPEKSGVSDFITVQSLMNFTVMTAIISTAWLSLQKLVPSAASIWVPYGFAFLWGGISFLMSLEGLKKPGEKAPKLGPIAAAIFIAVLNSLVLANAIIGTSVALGIYQPL
jgi:multisubunit Na+/H+ antiporter MnhB subunit